SRRSAQRRLGTSWPATAWNARSIRYTSSLSASRRAAPANSGAAEGCAGPGAKASGIGTSFGGAAKGDPHKDGSPVAAPKGTFTRQESPDPAPDVTARAKKVARW